MASSHKTEHYGLSQFAPLDRPAWLVDYNSDMEKIDTALHNLDETGGGSGTLDQTARDMAEAAQNAAKDAQGMATSAQATADEALEKAEEALNQQGSISGDITNINEEITQIKVDVNTAQSTATTANQTAEEALTLAQGCVKRSGDTMTGVLKLAGNPVADADAANKGYVDSVAGNPFPDVPFTDDRWKFAGEFDNTPKPFTFPYIPKQFLVVTDEWGPSGESSLIFETNDNSDARVGLGNFTTPNGRAVIFTVEEIDLVERSDQNFISLIFGYLTTSVSRYLQINEDLTVNISFSPTTGSLKLYWR